MLKNEGGTALGTANCFWVSIQIILSTRPRLSKFDGLSAKNRRPLKTFFVIFVCKSNDLAYISLNCHSLKSNHVYLHRPQKHKDFRVANLKINKSE